MTNYDFSTLSPLDFEELTCDLMNAHYKKDGLDGDFRTFAPGRDKGIDILLSSKSKNYEIIGQVKHYKKSPVSKLIYDLKNTERDKIFQLQPSKYIVITSQELSPQNKLDIQAIFHPFIIKLSDIYGRQDLNKILRENKRIEENHYKLWFSSSIVLNKIINYKYQGRQKEFTDVTLKKRFRLFVETVNFSNAKLILKQNKFIIITGEPGVGKSTLSDMMIYDFIKENFDLKIIYDDIKEIEDVLKDDDSKQIFYFDDFLGHTQAEIYRSKSAENALIRIISRIENLDNKYLILNTRKFILTSFLEESERFRKFNPLRSEAKIELKIYSYKVKRRMLENHILESDLKDEQKKVIKSLAHKICEHDNFTPRIIEFFTGSRVLKFNNLEYEKFILNNLNNPKEIWNHAYSYQINDYERFLLNTLYVNNGETFKNSLESAYNSRLNYEVQHNNFSKPLNSFNDSLRRLNNGFIMINNRDNFLGSFDAVPTIQFINPSLDDFLKFYINKNQEEKQRILLSSKFLNQWYFFYKPYISNKNDVNDILLSHFTNNSNKLILSKKDYNSYFLISIFEHYFNKESRKYVIRSLKKIKDWKFLKNNSNTQFYSKKFLNDVKSNNALNRKLSDLDSDFFFYSLMNENILEDFVELFYLFQKHYNFDLYKRLIKKPKKQAKLIAHISKIFNQEFDNNYYFLDKVNKEQDLYLDVADRLEKLKEFIIDSIDQSFDINIEILRLRDWNYRAAINMTESLDSRDDDVDDWQEANYFENQLFSNNEEITEDSSKYRANENISLDDLIFNENNNRINSINIIDDHDVLPF